MPNGDFRLVRRWMNGNFVLKYNLMSSSQYVLFCIILNTVGEEMFATTFVNVLAKVNKLISYLSMRLPSSADSG